MRTATAVGLFYCSQDELAAVRRHLPSSTTVTLYADDGSDAACDFAVIGSSAVKRRAVLTALREKLGSTPALLLLESADDDPSLSGDFAALTPAEMYRLPYVMRRELRLHQTETALRESERRYLDLLESAHEGVWAFDHEGTTTNANQRMADLLGVPAGSLKRTAFFDFVDPQQRAVALTKLQAVTNGIGEAHEIRFRRRDGTMFWASVSLSNVQDSRGESTGAMALVTDISARRQMELELRDRELQLTMAQQLSQIGSWDWDVENDVVTPSAELQQVFDGKLPPSGKLADFLAFVEPDERTRIVAGLHDAAADGSVFDAEFSVTVGGVSRVVCARGQVVSDLHPRRMIGMARDVTARKEREAALFESETRFRTILANIPEVVWRDDGKGKPVYVSENVVDVWGFTAEEFIEGEMEIWARNVHPADRDRVLAEYEALFSEGKRYDVEYRFRRRDGKWIWIHNRAELSEVNGQKHAFGVFSDVTERRRAADELARSEARYRALFEQASVIIYTIDPDGHFTSINKAFETITNWSVDEWIGRPFKELIQPEDVELATGQFQAVLRGDQVIGDYRMKTKDGGEVIIETTPQALRIDGEVIGTLGIGRDVTRRRIEEVEREKEQRLASLGELAASVAHTFNNVLMSILPFAELLKRRAPDDPKVDVATRHIFQAIKRGRQVSQEIQRLARPVSSLSISTIDVERWVSDLAREARAALGSSSVVETKINDRDLYVRGDQSLLQQVATNVIVNARDAMPNGGELTIAACLAENGQVEVSLTDSGSGIPEQLLDRIFEPLFTTKRSGTGLGLSIAHQAMVQQGGALRVSSRPGEGSTFTIVLGAVPAPVARDGNQKRSIDPRRIVLVEDDESVGEGIRALLVDEGYEVQLVTSGASALEIVGTFVPELVLLDVNLPDMSGFQVYEELSKRWPGLPVIFSTGHADARALGEAQHRNVPSIMKPYDIDELLAVVSRITA
jgi:PAS domain S-box-containing protein